MSKIDIYLDIDGISQSNALHARLLVIMKFILKDLMKNPFLIQEASVTS